MVYRNRHLATTHEIVETNSTERGSHKLPRERHYFITRTRNVRRYL